MRTFGLWGSNGPAHAVDDMIALVKDGAYTLMSHSLGQAQAIKQRHPAADILARFHMFEWPGKDPVAWAREVHADMRSNWLPLGIRRVVAANEMNLEPQPDFAEGRYRSAGRWYAAVAQELKRLEPNLIVHFPAYAAGHSEDQDDHGFVAMMLPEVKDAIRFCDWFNCHCYWEAGEGPLHEMSGFGGGLRYRKVQRLLKQMGLDRPIWIDEAGPFGQPQAVEQTLAHSQACQQDGVRVTYFLWFDPTRNPGNTINEWSGRIPADRLDGLRGAVGQCAHHDACADTSSKTHAAPHTYASANPHTAIGYRQRDDGARSDRHPSKR